MTTTELFHFADAHQEALLHQIKLNLRRFLHRHVSPDDCQEHLSAIVLETAEKLLKGRELSFATDQKLLNYLSKAACQHYSRELERRSRQRSNFDKTFYLNEFFPADHADFDTHEQELSAAQLYTSLMEYVYSKYSYIEAGVFKMYTLNDLTFDQLEQETGWSRGKCYNIVRKIRDDLKANYKSFI